MKLGPYELKNVQINDRMSQETTCFSADLWIEGKKFAAVSNRGHGGCNDWMPYSPNTYADIRALDERVKKDVPSLANETYEVADQMVGKLLTRHDVAKMLKRGMKNKALYLIGNQLHEMGYNGGKAPDERLFVHVMEKHPDAVILNSLPFGEAVEKAVAAGEEEYEAIQAAARAPAP